MVQDARPKLVVTHSSLKANFSGIAAPLICLDEPAQCESISRCPEQPPNYVLAPDSLAYVIYTSGSSGVPKGVEITHASLTKHNLAMVEAYHLTATDRVLQFTALSFDISVEEIFPTWLSGAALVLRTEDSINSPGHFLSFVASQEVTVLNLPRSPESAERYPGDGEGNPSRARLRAHKTLRVSASPRENLSS